MNDDQFDSVVKSLTSTTRRGALMLTGSALGGLGGLVGRSAAASGPGKRRDARKRKRKRERRHTRRKPGPPLYPDLQTEPPILAPPNSRFGIEDGTHVLRFTNTVWNAGQGRLELEAATSFFDVDAGELYQNLYDKPIDGTRLGRRRVDGEIVYHDGHGHYHFANFASYQLLRRDDAGEYQAIGESIKTSFCITDNFLKEGNLPQQYDRCERERQGLTPGWQDTYRWNLPEQWVVLDAWPMADGEYGLQSTADPDGLLDEGGGDEETNNTAVTYFTVENELIVNEREAP